MEFSGNRDDIEWHELQGPYYPIHSLLPREGSVLGNTTPGTVFLDTLPGDTVLQSAVPWPRVLIGLEKKQPVRVRACQISSYP